MSKASSSALFVKTQSHGGHDGPSETSWVPNTDVYVSDSGLVIKVELAGMRREDLQLVVEGNRVKITGHRSDGGRAPQCKFLLMEISYGSFETLIELPDGYDLSKACGAYQNGFLRIDVPLQGRNASSNHHLPKKVAG
jgi:HSP20 family protein